MTRQGVPGSIPTTDQVRSVPLVEFDSFNVGENNPFNVAWGAGVELSSHVIDVVQVMYQGVVDEETATIGSTKGIGWVGAPAPPDTVIMSHAIFVDMLLNARHPVSVQFEWIYEWRPLRSRRSYRWLPVQGNNSIVNREIPHMLQGLRVPSPWFRYHVRNENLSSQVTVGDVQWHLWLRSQ